MGKRFLLAAVLLFSFCPLFAAGPYIYGEFVYNMGLDLKINPFNGQTPDQFEGKPGEGYEEDILRNMLEESRWVFSAMIYGLDIVYTPSDIARQVERFYQADLKAEIPFGDPGLEIYDTYLEDNVFHAFIRYKLNSSQSRRLEYWNSGVFDSAASYGYFPFFGENSRIEAIKDGIRIALENQLKPEIYNKPESIEGEVILRECPLLSVDAGKYRAFVKIRSNIEIVRSYRGSN